MYSLISQLSDIQRNPALLVGSVTVGAAPAGDLGDLGGVPGEVLAEDILEASGLVGAHLLHGVVHGQGGVEVECVVHDVDESLLSEARLVLHQCMHQGSRTALQTR